MVYNTSVNQYSFNSLVQLIFCKYRYQKKHITILSVNLVLRSYFLHGNSYKQTNVSLGESALYNINNIKEKISIMSLSWIRYIFRHFEIQVEEISILNIMLYNFLTVSAVYYEDCYIISNESINKYVILSGRMTHMCVFSRFPQG